MASSDAAPPPTERGQWHGRALPVPYVTAWSREFIEHLPVVLRPDGRGIGYQDEVPADRNARGVLLQRIRRAQGQGRPLFGAVHGARQRHAMTKLLCQVCGDPADVDRRGVLWLLVDYREDWAGWPDGMGCVEPPVCAPCATVSVRLCPALKKSHALLRVRHAPVAGVSGIRWGVAPLGLRPLGGASAEHGDPSQPWMLASYVIRELHDVTFVTEA